VVFITGALPDEAQLQSARERGADFLQKPFKVEALVRLLRKSGRLQRGWTSDQRP
jgi:FixJ family two-component response regulator